MTMNNQNGLTLVELMVVLLLSFIVSAAMYSLYTVQQKSTVIQTEVADMQQNLRAGLDTILHDIRMAGYAMQDTDRYGVSAASATSMSFTYDVNDNGGVPASDEQFVISVSADGNLTKTSGGEAVAKNVERIEFCYSVRDDTGTTTQTTTPDSSTELDKIWAVEISLLVFSDRGSSNYLNDDTYSTPCGSTWGFGIDWNTGDDDEDVRRRFFTKRVVLRNSGV